MSLAAALLVTIAGLLLFLLASGTTHLVGLVVLVIGVVGLIFVLIEGRGRTV